MFRIKFGNDLKDFIAEQYFHVEQHFIAERCFNVEQCFIKVERVLLLTNISV